MAARQTKLNNFLFIQGRNYRNEVIPKSP